MVERCALSGSDLKIKFRTILLTSIVFGKDIHLHFTTSPHGHSTTCIKLLFYRLKIRPLHDITIKLIAMQGHQNPAITKSMISY